MATLGPLIHNPQGVADLEARGAVPSDTADGGRRLRGGDAQPRRAGQSVYDKTWDAALVRIMMPPARLWQKSTEIAARGGRRRAMPLVAGETKHPEVQGIVGTHGESGSVLPRFGRARKSVADSYNKNGIFVVAQTTFQVKSWQETCVEFLEKAYTNAKYLIQYVMQRGRGNRRRRASPPMRPYGRHRWASFLQHPKARTRRGAPYKAAAVETAHRARPRVVARCRIGGVTAGASTPSSIIEEVLNCMSEEIREEHEL